MRRGNRYLGRGALRPLPVISAVVYYYYYYYSTEPLMM